MAPNVELQDEIQGGNFSVVSRNELATLLVNEQARFLDELEEPEPTSRPLRAWTDIAHMTLARMFDWHSKVYLLKSLALLESCSAKSKTFRSMLLQASTELTNWHSELGTGYLPDWSVWTVYHDILRWRHAGHSMAALQKKGVEYTPWSKTRELYEAAREIAAQALKKDPAISAAGLHRHVNKVLAERASEK